MKKMQWYSIIVTLLALVFFGCSDTQESFNPGGGSEEIAFSYSLTGVHTQKLQNRAERVPVNVIAQMKITDLSDNSSTIVDWNVTIDEDALTIESNMTYVLTPGSYRFELSITHNNNTYAGQAEQLILDGDQLEIPLRVTPVIGETHLDVTVNNLAKMLFNYPAEELAAIVNPQMGYSIDGGAETIVALNKTTGASEVYLSISEGNHTISLKLYDGNTQVGKSKIAQESVNIVPNGNVVVDIVPLHGEIQVTMPIDNGSGTISLTIPEEVVSEAGSLANLRTVVKLSSPQNGSFEKEMVLSQSGLNYVGSLDFDSLQYDTATITVEFWDIAESELLGSVVYSNVILDNSGTSLTEELILIRRAIISGHIQAVVGVNVFDQSGDLVEGATVYVNDELIGLTGSAWGTSGYLKFFHNKGEVTIKVETDSSVCDTVVVLNPLSVENYTLTLVKSDNGSGNGSVLVRDGVYGYRVSGGLHTEFSRYLDSAASVGVDVRSSLDNSDWISQYGALFVNYASPDLTTAEITNIRQFLAQGKKVVIIGDQNGDYPTWNTNIVTVVENGGASISSDGTGGLKPYVKDQEHELTANTDTIGLYDPSFVSGGTSLYGNGGVVLFGDQNNLLYVMDEGSMENALIDYYDTRQFMRNMVNWMVK